MSTVAIIPARGGSRGIPRKNLLLLAGKPLVAWSVEQAVGARLIDQVYVSSDDDEILQTAERYGATPIRRPAEISGDRASSESAWLHALEEIERAGVPVDLIVGMQPTSPVREPADLDAAIESFRERGLDSLVSCCEVEDFFMWKLLPDGLATGANHDYTQRKPRQQIQKRYLENGSFYLFTPALLRRQNNRLGGRIGIHKMPPHKMFQIDDPEDVRLCEVILRGYGLANGVS